MWDKIAVRSVWSKYIVLMVLLLAGLPLRAQYSSGIEGTVTDQSGAVIPGAQLTVTNQDTQVKQSAVANGQGFAQVLHLPPGPYSATVTATGFGTWEQKGINIEGTDIRTMYPKLTVGATESVVEVSANGSAVETNSGTISRVLEQQTVENAPLVGENLYASVATLAPGVTGLGGSFGGANVSGSQGTNSFNAEPGFQIIGAGQRQEANEYQIDGSSVNGNSRDGIANLTPEPDTVAQMKISTDTFSADKGRQSGALIEVFTKAGTNKFHGTLSEFYTGSALTARTEFQSRVPRYIRNDFGGTVGGPIFKDKTFFFGGLFWSKSHQGVTLTQPIETPDFVNYVETNLPNSLAARFFKDAPAGGVPTSGFQTVGEIEQKLISPYPVSNIPTNLIALGNVSINQSPINNGFQGHVRLDHNFQEGKDKLFYSLYRNTTQAGVANVRPTLAYVSPNATWYHKIDYVHTFSAKLLNEASVSYVRADGSQPVAPGDLPNLPNAYSGGLGTGFSSWGLESPAAGRVLTAYPVAEGEYYGVSKLVEVPSRTLSPTDLDGYELVPEKFRSHLRSRLGITRGGRAWDGGETLDLGVVQVGDHAIHLVYALRQPGDGIGEELRTHSGGSQFILLLPFGEAYDTELANVMIETAVPTKGGVVRAAIKACGITESVPAIYSAPEEAKLVVDSKQKKIWIEGVEITGIQPDTHGYFFVETLGRHPGPLSLVELSKKLSQGRQDGDLTARQAKTHVRKMIAEAMAAAGRSFDEDPFPSGGRGCYRCALPPYVQ